MKQLRILTIHLNQKIQNSLQQYLFQQLHVQCLFIACDENLNILEKLAKQSFSFIIIYADLDSEFEKIMRMLRHEHSVSRIILICRDEDVFFRRQRFTIFFALRQARLQEDMQQFIKKLINEYECNLVYHFHQINTNCNLYICNIYYIESMKNYIILHTEKESLKDRVTMKEICKEPTLSNFILISRGIFVNPFYIMEVREKKVCLTNGTVLYISRNLYSSVKKLLVLNDEV